MTTTASRTPKDPIPPDISSSDMTRPTPSAGGKLFPGASTPSAGGRDIASPRTLRSLNAGETNASGTGGMGIAPRSGAHRRLLAAARCRFAEDRLAEAVSAGMRQVVLLGTALDTFACHNPYHELRVFEVVGWAFGSPAIRFDLLPPGFDRDAPAFVIRLVGDEPLIDESSACASRAALAATLDHIGSWAEGTEIVFDHVPLLVPTLPEILRDTGFEVLEEVGPAALASRYLDRPVESTHSSEPWVVRARVRHNVGRPPSSLVLE